MTITVFRLRCPYDMLCMNFSVSQFSSCTRVASYSVHSKQAELREMLVRCRPMCRGAWRNVHMPRPCPCAPCSCKASLTICAAHAPHRSRACAATFKVPLLRHGCRPLQLCETGAANGRLRATGIDGCSNIFALSLRNRQKSVVHITMSALMDKSEAMFDYSLRGYDHICLCCNAVQPAVLLCETLWSLRLLTQNPQSRQHVRADSKHHDPQQKYSTSFSKNPGRKLKSAVLTS